MIYNLFGGGISTQVQTQGFMHGRLALYHWAPYPTITTNCVTQHHVRLICPFSARLQVPLSFPLLPSRKRFWSDHSHYQKCFTLSLFISNTYLAPCHCSKVAGKFPWYTHKNLCFSVSEPNYVLVGGGMWLSFSQKKVIPIQEL